MRTPLIALTCTALVATIVPLAWAEEETDAPEAPRPWFVRVLTPTEASKAMLTELSEKSPQQQRMLRPRMAAEYVEAWDASGQTLETPEDALALHQLASSGRLYDKAVQAAVHVFEQEGLPVPTRLQAAQGIAGLLTRDPVVAALGGDRVRELAEALEAFARSDDMVEGQANPSRVFFGLARYYGDDAERAIALNMAAARAKPDSASSAARSILRLMMSSTTELEAYPALQAQAKEHFDELRTLAAGYVAALPADTDERTKQRAESMVKRLDGAEAPLMMLGQPAPAWTLEHAFGDVKSLEDVKGKVVFVDFWATWCGWCIKSFPAVRDLVRDYADKDLAILGVTTTASSVSDSNFTLDDDMKHKLKDGPARRYIRRASERAPADPEKGVYAEEAFREKEREMLEAFLANHELSWPVLMIDKDEPSKLYGLQGWPHAVVIDKQGRVRYFKVGALLRDRAEQVAHFREILDALLAEEGDA